MGMGSGCGILRYLGPPPHRQGNGSRMLFPHPLAVLPGTLLVALAGGADTLADVAEFTVDHQAWFRLWLPLGKTVPTGDTIPGRICRSGCQGAES